MVAVIVAVDLVVNGGIDDRQLLVDAGYQVGSLTNALVGQRPVEILGCLLLFAHSVIA